MFLQGKEKNNTLGEGGKLFADFLVSRGILEIIQQIKSYMYPYTRLVLRYIFMSL
jgi:hypothetical protein